MQLLPFAPQILEIIFVCLSAVLTALAVSKAWLARRIFRRKDASDVDGAVRDPTGHVIVGVTAAVEALSPQELSELINTLEAKDRIKINTLIAELLADEASRHRA